MISRYIALATIAFGVACAGDKPAADTSQLTNGKLGETAGMKVPESVRYDAELDVYYVSNINGNPSQKDNNGFIAKVRADSTSVVTMLVEGGKNGATLNAPKGMALRGDTLFVCDIDAIRMFNRRTGASLGLVSFANLKATFLNDIASGPDGVYITDSGIRFDEKGEMSQTRTSAVYRLSGGRITALARGDSLTNANGIAWDEKNKRWILAPFGGKDIQSLAEGQKQPALLLGGGPGGYDGVEVLQNGDYLITSWNDSTLWIAHGGTHLMPLIKGLSAPADIGVDTRRNVVAVPRFNDGKVEYYKIP